MAVKKIPLAISELFPELDTASPLRGLQVKTYAHDDDDPGRVLVPQADAHFIFQTAVLEVLLLGEMLGRNVYLHGDSGSGKTMSTVQFCARIGKEVFRQNFDEHLARPELVGSPRLLVEEGRSVMKFVRGSLLSSLARPATFIADEFDSGAPAAVVVLNPVLEMESKMGYYVPELEELVFPHKSWRCVATGNTDGVNPDPRGLYTSTQQQSFASMNRFPLRAKVHYNNAEQEKEIILRKYPKLKGDSRKLDLLLKFVREYRTVFQGDSGTLTIPLSTRSLHVMVEVIACMGTIKAALETVFLPTVPAHEMDAVISIAERVGVGQIGKRSKA